MSYFFSPFGGYSQPTYTNSPFGYDYPQQHYQRGYRPQQQQYPQYSRQQQQQQYYDDSEDDDDEQPQQLVQLSDGSLAYRPIPSQKHQRAAQLRKQQEQAAAVAKAEATARAEAERQNRLKQLQLQKQQQEAEAAFQAKQRARQQQQQKQQRQQRQEEQYEDPSTFWSSLFGQPQQRETKPTKKENKKSKSSKSSQQESQSKPVPQSTSQSKQVPPVAPKPTIFSFNSQDKPVSKTTYLNNLINGVRTTVSDEIEDETPVSESDYHLTDVEDVSFDAPLIVDVEPAPATQELDNILTGWESTPIAKKKIVPQQPQQHQQQEIITPIVQPPQQQVKIEEVIEPQTPQKTQSSTLPSQPTSTNTENEISSLNDSHLEQLLAQTESLYKRRSTILAKIKSLDQSNSAHTTQFNALQRSLKQLDALIEQTHKHTQELIDLDM